MSGGLAQTDRVSVVLCGCVGVELRGVLALGRWRVSESVLSRLTYSSVSRCDIVKSGKVNARRLLYARVA